MCFAVLIGPLLLDECMGDLQLHLNSLSLFPLSRLSSPFPLSSLSLSLSLFLERERERERERIEREREGELVRGIHFHVGPNDAQV